MNIKLISGIVLILIGIILLFVFKNKVRTKIIEWTEKNSVKIPNLSWYEKDGTAHTEDIILKRSRIPIIGDWIRIYPIVDEDGKTNWINAIFGGSKNFIKVLLILFIIALFIFGYYEVFNSYEVYKQTCIQINNTFKLP